jgi:hypothetical protein
MWIASVDTVSAFEYSPQAPVTQKETITVDEGDPVEMSVDVGGSQNTYSWIKDGTLIAGEDANSLNIASAVAGDAGMYQCLVQNTLVPGLDIVSDTFTVVVNVVEGIGDLANSFRVNGNPVTDILSVDADHTIDFVTITDITGKIVKKERVSTSTIRMEVSELRQGIYLVTLQSVSDERIIIKIVKK